MPDALADFTKEPTTLEGKTRDVYRKGTGPAVIVMAEIPGITPAVANFARAVADNGCTAVLPHLFGKPGADVTNGYALKVMLGACISREFTMFARNRTSPITGWLRALAVVEKERCGGPGVGAVGMCLTGGFALAMMVEPAVIAPVLSQPSLPVAAGPWGKRNGNDLGVFPDDLAVVKQRTEDEDLCMLGFRYGGDPLVPAARFERLQAELGDRFIGTTFPSATTRDHSVLTEQLQQKALDDVLAFFHDRLHT